MNSPVDQDFFLNQLGRHKEHFAVLASLQDPSANAVRTEILSAISDWLKNSIDTLTFAKILQDGLLVPKGPGKGEWEKAKLNNPAIATMILGSLTSEQILALLKYRTSGKQETVFDSSYSRRLNIEHAVSRYPVAELLAQAPYVPIQLAAAAAAINYANNAEQFRGVCSDGLHLLEQEILDRLRSNTDTNHIGFDEFLTIDPASDKRFEFFNSKIRQHIDSAPELIDNVTRIVNLRSHYTAINSLVADFNSGEFLGQDTGGSHDTRLAFTNFPFQWPANNTGSFPVTNYFAVSENVLTGDAHNAVISLVSDGTSLDEPATDIQTLQNSTTLPPDTGLGVYSFPAQAPLGSPTWRRAERELAARVQVLRDSMESNSTVALLHFDDNASRRFAADALHESGIDLTLRRKNDADDAKRIAGALRPVSPMVRTLQKIVPGHAKRVK